MIKRRSCKTPTSHSPSMLFTTFHVVVGDASHLAKSIGSNSVERLDSTN